MKRFPITSIIKYLFIILIIGFFIILLLPAEKKTSKIEEKPESTVVEKNPELTVVKKNIKKILPACVAKLPTGHPIVRFFKYPGYLKEAEKCRKIRLQKFGNLKKFEKKPQKPLARPKGNPERKINKEILTPKKESGD